MYIILLNSLFVAFFFHLILIFPSVDYVSATADTFNITKNEFQERNILPEPVSIPIIKKRPNSIEKIICEIKNRRLTTKTESKNSYECGSDMEKNTTNKNIFQNYENKNSTKDLTDTSFQNRFNQFIFQNTKKPNIFNTSKKYDTFNNLSKLNADPLINRENLSVPSDHSIDKILTTECISIYKGTQASNNSTCSLDDSVEDKIPPHISIKNNIPDSELKVKSYFDILNKPINKKFNLIYVLGLLDYNEEKTQYNDKEIPSILFYFKNLHTIFEYENIIEFDSKHKKNICELCFKGCRYFSHWKGIDKRIIDTSKELREIVDNFSTNLLKEEKEVKCGLINKSIIFNIYKKIWIHVRIIHQFIKYNNIFIDAPYKVSCGNLYKDNPAYHFYRTLNIIEAYIGVHTMDYFSKYNMTLYFDKVNKDFIISSVRTYVKMNREFITKILQKFGTWKEINVKDWAFVVGMRTKGNLVSPYLNNMMTLKGLVFNPIMEFSESDKGKFINTNQIIDNIFNSRLSFLNLLSKRIVEEFRECFSFEELIHINHIEDNIDFFMNN